MTRRALVANGGDPKQVGRAARTVQRDEEQLAASLQAVLSTPAGRLVLWRLLEDTHVYGTSFDHSGSVMYFREGARNVGLTWRARILAADEPGYELMAREARARDRRVDAETAAAHIAPSSTTEEIPDGSEG